MIKNIIYIEDGSVDIDELKEGLNEETKVIVYRQGSRPPVIIQPEKPIGNESVSPENIVRRTIIEIQDILSVMEKNMSKSVAGCWGISELKHRISDLTDSIIEGVLK